MMTTANGNTKHAAGPSPVLIGLRGCGKSTIGALLAEQLGTRFVDLDDRSPALLGAVSAAEAINTHGLPAFRTAEHDALKIELRSLAHAPAVLALGGGTPTAPGTDALLRDWKTNDRIRVIYLHALPSVLRDRLSATDTSTRPSLTGMNMLDEIETIYLQRDGLYRELSDEVVEVGEAEIAETVRRLKALYDRHDA